MFSVALLVASIAIVDSINPSTVLPALYLASGPRARGLGSFTVGVFAVYSAGGVALVLGPGPALIAAMRDVGPRVEQLVAVGAGAVLIVLAAIAWRARNKPDGGHGRRRLVNARGPAFALGAGIAAIELPTAFIYFGAVSAIAASHAAAPVQVGLVAAYNALFVLPLVAILAVRVRAGERAEERLEASRAWLRRAAPRAFAGLAGAAGAVLAALGAHGLLLAQ
jgi:cytochrome c biogenesis protein CcdA